MIAGVFLFALAAALGIALPTVLQLRSNSLQFWPPPEPAGWQSSAFRWLFRLMLLGLIVLSYLDFDSLGWPVQRYYVAAPLGILGFGAAFFLTGVLGWKNAFGAVDGLKTTGIYRWSRNPIYVVTIVGMIGWGVCVASGYAWVILTLWAFFYIVAAYTEEPWLASSYGERYREYKSTTRRFV